MLELIPALLEPVGQVLAENVPQILESTGGCFSEVAGQHLPELVDKTTCLVAPVVQNFNFDLDFEYSPTRIFWGGKKKPKKSDDSKKSQ